MGDVDLSLVERIDHVEKQLAEIRRRLDVIERNLALRADHPVDRTAVREKVTFDWQA